MASADFTIEATSAPPEAAVDFGETVNLALVSTSGVRTVAWSIIGTSREGLALPAITPAGSPSGVTASFVAGADPADGLGISYIVQCLVNGGRDDEGTEDSSLLRTALVGVENDAGIVPFAFGESLERSATHGYTEVFNEILNNAGGGVGSSIPEIITEATTARTLGLTDANDYIRCTSGSATSVTVPLNATAAFAIGDSIAIRQAGAGQVTIVATGGVTINTPYTLKTRAQHCTVVLTKVATNTWDLTGDLATS